MAQQIINVGSAPNDGTGDVLRNSQIKANANFTELYTNKAESSEVLSNDETTYTAATLPLAGTEEMILNDGSGWKRITWTNIKAQLKTYFDTVYKPLSETLITNASVTGTYNIDWSAGDVWNLTLTGNTTLTESNLPASGTTKTINLQIVGNYTLAYPTDWTDFITGSFIGAATLNTLTCQYFGSTKYKVQIVQPD